MTGTRVVCFGVLLACLQVSALETARGPIEPPPENAIHRGHAYVVGGTDTGAKLGCISLATGRVVGSYTMDFMRHGGFILGVEDRLLVAGTGLTMFTIPPAKFEKTGLAVSLSMWVRGYLNALIPACADGRMSAMTQAVWDRTAWTLRFVDVTTRPVPVALRDLNGRRVSAPGVSRTEGVRSPLGGT